jgi:hypothetical protein
LVEWTEADTSDIGILGFIVFGGLIFELLSRIFFK